MYALGMCGKIRKIDQSVPVYFIEICVFTVLNFTWLFVSSESNLVNAAVNAAD